MHGGHHHDDHLHHDHTPPGRTGHNRKAAARQWQTPHLPEGQAAPNAGDGELDLDLVEKAFLDAFPRAPDPTSFLRLAGVPFLGRAEDGSVLSLLRVETSSSTDIGALTPQLGGGHHYDPLPAKLVSQRQALALVYFDGTLPIRLTLAEAKALDDVTPAR